MGLPDAHEDQWRLEDEGKAQPDPNKNFEEIIKTLTDSVEVTFTKDEHKDEWTLSQTPGETRAAIIAGQKAIEAERAAEDPLNNFQRIAP